MPKTECSTTPMLMPTAHGAAHSDIHIQRKEPPHLPLLCLSVFVYTIPSPIPIPHSLFLNSIQCQWAEEREGKPEWEGKEPGLCCVAGTYTTEYFAFCSRMACFHVGSLLPFFPFFSLLLLFWWMVEDGCPMITRDKGTVDDDGRRHPRSLPSLLLLLLFVVSFSVAFSPRDQTDQDCFNAATYVGFFRMNGVLSSFYTISCPDPGFFCRQNMHVFFFPVHKYTTRRDESMQRK